MTAAIREGHMALLVELKKADQIILAMLNAMTSAQKSKVHVQLDAASVSGEGVTRHHERRAVILTAEAALAQPTAEQALPDAINHALDALNVAGAAASFLNDNIHPAISAIVALANSDIDATRGRMSLIRDLAKLGLHLVEEAAGHMEAEESEMQSKLALLQGGAQ